MKGFDPYLNPGELDDPGSEFQAFTDAQLLLELRRRKVLARVDYHNVAPGYAVAQGYPLDRQIREAYEGLADQLNRAHQPDRQPPGCKVERGGFLPGSFSQHEHPDRKVTLVLNYVVDFKR